MRGESLYYSCRGCGSPCHTINECLEFKQSCEDKKREIYASAAYQEDLFDALNYPSSSDYQIGFLGVNEEVKAYWENYHNYYYQNSQPAYNQYHTLNQVHNHYADQYVNSPQAGLLDSYQSEDEARVARLESRIQRIDEYLSAPELPYEERIYYMNMKCRFLKMKIQFEESISPLPVDIRSYWEEEVVDVITTTNSLPDEEPRVECMVVEDEPKVIQVLPNPPVILVIAINKCRDEELIMKPRKVDLYSIGQIIMAWLHKSTIWYSHYTFMNLILLLSWCVNYRVYIGNSVGKCSIRPP